MGGHTKKTPQIPLPRDESEPPPDSFPSGLPSPYQFFQFKELILPTTSTVYFLIKDNRVVYVGQSVCLWERLGRHLRTGRLFTDVWFLEVEPLDLDRVEKFFIKYYNPEGNSNHAS